MSIVLWKIKIYNIYSYKCKPESWLSYEQKSVHFGPKIWNQTKQTVEASPKQFVRFQIKRQNAFHFTAYTEDKKQRNTLKNNETDTVIQKLWIIAHTHTQSALYFLHVHSYIWTLIHFPTLSNTYLIPNQCCGPLSSWTKILSTFFL